MKKKYMQWMYFCEIIHVAKFEKAVRAKGGEWHDIFSVKSNPHYNKSPK